MGEEFRQNLVIVRRNRATIGTLLAVEVAGLAWFASAFVVEEETRGRLGWTYPLVFVLVLLAPFVALARWRRRDYEEVVVDASSVRVGERFAMPRTAIRSVETLERGEVEVRLRTRWSLPDLGLSFGDLPSARPLLKVLGHDVTQRCMVLPLPSPLLGSPWSGLVVILAALFVVPTPFAVVAGMLGRLVSADAQMVLLLAATPIAWVSTAIVCFIPRRLRVGMDGFAYSWLGSGRYIPHRDVAGARPTVSTVRTRRGSSSVASLELRLASGPTVKLPVARGREHDVLSAAEGILRSLRLLSDIGGEVERDDPGFPIPPLTTNAEAWLAEVRARAAGGEGAYRSAAPERGSLWRAIRDPRAARPRRAAAAAILSVALGPGDADRLRDVAMATADPVLARVFEAAAIGEPRRLVSTLEKITS